MPWDQRFLELFERCLARYRSGDRDWSHYYDAADLALLSSIGCRQREFFDFVEDFGDTGDPPPSTALLVAAVRREYFLTTQQGVTSTRVLQVGALPTFGDAIAGIHYLPRIIAKARAKLRGELDPDIMFCCGGDRKFFRDHRGIHPADFLRQVWLAGDNDMALVEFVRRGSPATG
jgi:hypothetical protein